MTQHTHTHRRADRGTLVVRASVVAAGLAASMGPQLVEAGSTGPAAWAAGSPSVLCTMGANDSFAFQ